MVTDIQLSAQCQVISRDFLLLDVSSTLAVKHVRLLLIKQLRV